MNCCTDCMYSTCPETPDNIIIHIHNIFIYMNPINLKMKLKSILITTVVALGLTAATMAQNDLRYFNEIKKQEIGLKYPVKIVYSVFGKS